MRAGYLQLIIKNLIKKLNLLDLLVSKKKGNYWKYNVGHYGLNFRLTDFQCALGINQLKKIDIFFKKKKIYFRILQ